MKAISLKDMIEQLQHVESVLPEGQTSDQCMVTVYDKTTSETRCHTDYVLRVLVNENLEGDLDDDGDPSPVGMHVCLITDSANGKELLKETAPGF